MPEFAFLSLFDEKLSIDDKQLLAVNLLLQNLPSEFEANQILKIQTEFWDEMKNGL